MTNPVFNAIKKINLGADSELELVQVLGTKYILKTFKNDDIITKRNREFYYHKELENLGLKHFSFDYLDIVKPDQLCMEYLENLETFDVVKDSQKFTQLAKYIQNVWQLSSLNNSKSVDKKQITDVSISSYFEYLKADILKRKCDDKYISLRHKIIDELQDITSTLTLLHSDFHEHNIGYHNGKVIFFDSGNSEFLYGHKYHDLTRIFMYYPESVIFKNESINPRIKSFVGGLEFDLNELEFQKFCFLQSLLIYNNTWIIRRHEIAEFLYQKLIQ